MTTPADLAQRQLDAYNAGDLNAFLACYHHEVEVRSFPAQELLMQGLVELHARYEALFAERRPQAELLGRMAVGDVVIDHERVTGLSEGAGPVEAIAIYEVVDARIRRVFFAHDQR